jgi:hypothetical protein
MAEILIPGVGNATGPQIGKEILVPGSGNYISKAPTGTTPTLSAPGVVSITSTTATPQVTLTF